MASRTAAFPEEDEGYQQIWALVGCYAIWQVVGNIMTRGSGSVPPRVEGSVLWMRPLPATLYNVQDSTDCSRVDRELGV